jgi:hypothetical protein
MPRRPARPAPPTGDISVPVDPSLKKAWDAESKKLEAYSSQGARSFDHLWETVARIVEHEPPLYVVGGYKNAKAFFLAVLHESERNARRNVRVAKHATPAEEQTYGVHLLDAAIGYVEASQGKPIAKGQRIDFGALHIPVGTGKSANKLPLAKATIPDVTRATAALLASKGKGRKKVVEVEMALTAALGKHASLASVVVHEHDGLVDFRNVPIAALAAFARVAASKVAKK